MSCLTLFVPESIPLSPKEGEEINLNSQALPDGGSFIFGRDADCNYVIAYRTVSGHHCSIGYDPAFDHWELADLGSTNGTWLNGRRMPPKDKTPLNIGDRFTLGTLWEPFVVLDRPNDTVGEGEPTAIRDGDDDQAEEQRQSKTYGDVLYELAQWLVSGQTVAGKIERVLILSGLVAGVIVLADIFLR